MSENGEAARLFVTVDGNTTKATTAVTGLDKTVKGAAMNIDRHTKAAASSFKNLDGVASQLSGGLGSLNNVMGMLGVAGFGALVIGAGKSVLGLEAMREESAQLEARFVGFSGGVQKAAATFRKFDSALGNALSKDQEMAAAASLLGTGVAKTAQEAAELTRQALILGIGVDTLTQALESGRATGLIQYGLSLTDIKKRAQELKDETVSLTDTEAQAIAIKEQLAAKAKLVADAGGKAATSIQELKNAWDTFKDTVADKVDVEVVVKWVTQGISNGAFALSEQGQTERDYGQAFELYKQAVQRRMDIEAKLEGVYARINPIAKANYENQLKEAQSAEEAALKSLQLAQALQDVALNGDPAAKGIDAVGDAAATAKGEVASLTEQLKASLMWYGEFAGFADSSKAVLASSPFGAAAKMQADMGVSQDWIGPTVLEYNKAAADARIERIEAETQASKVIANEAARAYEQEMEAAASRVEGYIRNAMDASKGLSDLTGGAGKDLWAPGANGPFEDIYRLQAWLKDGSWAETAAAKGFTDKDKGFVAGLIGQFQNGLFTPEVIDKLINVDALVQSAKMEDQSKKLLEAFSQSIAKQAGVSVNITNDLLKVADGEKAGKNLIEAAARGAESAKGAAVRKVEDIAKAMIAAMAAVLNPANSVVAQTAAAAAVATSAASNTGASGGARGPGAPGAPAKVVNVSGDSYTMMVADPGSAVLAAALIADRKAARLDSAMGG